MIKRVVFVVSTLDSGGVENYLLRFLKFYDKKIEPIVFCRGNHFGELEDDYRKISHIKLIKMNLSNFDIGANKLFYSFLKTSKSDTFVDFSGHFSGILMVLAKYAGIKKRIVFYRESTHQFKVTLFKLLYISLVKLLTKAYSTKILSNSISALNNFYPNRDKNDSKFKVIYNGIDFNKESVTKYKREDFGIPSDSFVVGHTGRYNFAKNHETIIKVAESLCWKYKNIYFVLCGKNTDTILIKSVSGNEALKDKVKLLGYRKDIESILPIFDLFFFPSITEGQPNSLIEAMVSGLPIVASNIDPILETTPLELHDELLNPMDVLGFSKKIEQYYLKEKTNYNLAIWAEKKFMAEVLFQEFFNEL